MSRANNEESQAFIEGLLYTQNQGRAWMDSRLRQGYVSFLKQWSDMCLAFAENSTAFLCFYLGFLPYGEESGQETEERGSALLLRGPCKSPLVGQNSGMVVSAHFRCRNWYLERGTEGRKQDLSNSLKIMALHPLWVIFISSVGLKTVAIHIRWHEKGDEDTSVQFGPN